MAQITATMTDLGGYSATCTPAGTVYSATMVDAPVALPSTAVQASVGMVATSTMGVGATRLARQAVVRMVATSAMGANAGMVVAPAQIALGAWIPPVAPLWSHDHAANYQALVGVKPPIVHWYQDIATNKLWNQYGDITLATAQGVVPLITYELRNAGQAALMAPYTNAAILAGTYDAVITAFATAAEAWGHPFLLRPFHEMTYHDYPWACGPGNTQGNTPASLIAAWRYVWHLFRNAGATNAKFVFCPSVPLAGLEPMAHCYPGDTYVDWLGLDGYAWPSPPGSNFGWRLFGPTFQAGYDQITVIGPQPLIICETGVAALGGDKSAWIADMAQTATSLFPRLKSIVWFNNVRNNDWRFNDTTPHLN